MPPLLRTSKHLLLLLPPPLLLLLVPLIMSASGEEAQEGLKYETWVLKVLIHCEGCKREVKKALQSIDGVYTTTVDSQKHKATVTGNVAAETLIKKLLKIGKHAELLPDMKPDNLNNTNSSSNKNNKKKNKSKKEENSEPRENASNKQTTISTANHSETQKKQDNLNGNIPKDAVKESSNTGENSEAGGVGDGYKKIKHEENNMDNNKMAVEAEKGGGGGGGGNLSMYPQPAYIMSYSTAHPSSSYGAAYYPMPMQHSGHAYSAYPSPPGTYIASPEILSLASLMPESYVVSDEENGCIIM